jgi:hypothetical protein
VDWKLDERRRIVANDLGSADASGRNLYFYAETVEFELRWLRQVVQYWPQSQTGAHNAQTIQGKTM